MTWLRQTAEHQCTNSSRRLLASGFRLRLSSLVKFAALPKRITLHNIERGEKVLFMCPVSLSHTRTPPSPRLPRREVCRRAIAIPFVLTCFLLYTMFVSVPAHLSVRNAKAKRQKYPKTEHFSVSSIYCHSRAQLQLYLYGVCC